jgi:nucleotide-binding universal stress UspA family protein
MQAFHHILVGVDAQGLAADAVVQGLALAEALGACLRFVHAVDLPASLPTLGGRELSTLQAKLEARSRAATLDAMRRAVAKTPFEGRDLESLLEVRVGHPAQVVLAAAQDSAADLILLGRHAKGSAADFGSTVRAVLSRAVVPVWTQVKKPAPIRRILVAVDFSEHGERALELARRLAKGLGASLHALHVFVPPSRSVLGAFAEAFPGRPTFPSWQEEEERRKLGALAAEIAREGVEVAFEVAEGAPREVLLARSASYDLVVMGTHGRTGLSRFLLGGVALGVLKEAKTPVLVVPIPKTDWLLRAHEERPAETARR